MEKSEFAKNVAKLRDLKGLTQDQLAEAVGVSKDAIQAIEYGKTSAPKINTLIKLAGALSVNVNQLIGAPTKDEAKADLILGIIAILPALNDLELRTIHSMASKLSSGAVRKITNG